MGLRRHWAYLLRVLNHRYLMWQEGRKLGLSLWCILLHDNSKFLPSEWFPYARTFYTAKGQPQTCPSVEYWVACNHHHKRNKHHYQYWVCLTDQGNTVVCEMPDKYRRELLADWRAASKAYGKISLIEWYTARRDKIVLHDNTRAWLEERLYES